MTLSGVCTELLKDDTSFHLVLHVLSQKIFYISCNLLVTFFSLFTYSIRESWPNEPETTSDEVKIQVSTVMDNWLTLL